MQNQKELRKERRLQADNLPEALQSFTILLAGEIEKKVITVDASTRGFGFIADGDPDLFIVGSRIILYPMGKDSPLHGTIVHIAKVPRGFRVGISMMETSRFEAWRQVIEAIMETTESGETTGTDS